MRSRGFCGAGCLMEQARAHRGLCCSHDDPIGWGQRTAMVDVSSYKLVNIKKCKSNKFYGLDAHEMILLKLVKRAP